MYRSLLVASFAALTANVFGMDPGYHGECSNGNSDSLLREVKHEHFGENSLENSRGNVQNNRIDENNLISSMLKVFTENSTLKSKIRDTEAEAQKTAREKDSKIQELTNQLTIMKQRLIKANNDVFNKFYEKRTLKRSRSFEEEEIQRELNSNKLRHVISKNNETIAEYKNKKEALEAKNQELKTILNDTATELEKIQNLQAENENTHRKEKEALVIEIQKLQKENQKKDKAITDFQNKEDTLKRKLDEANQKVSKKQRTKSLKVFEGRVLNTRKNPEINLSKYRSFPNLKELTIKADQLSDILLNKPDLSKVTYLDILEGKNPLDIEQLVSILSHAESIETLRLDGNRLIALPKEIGNLKQLRNLYVDGNLLTSLPKEIGNLRNLKHLYLWENKLTELPKEIYELPKLEELDVKGNLLKKLSRKDFVSSDIHIFQ
jgi:chromosome segregation ATPase